MPRIAVDLTPLRPGGENGGAKLLVWQLLTAFQQLDHPYTFLLLTAGWNHQELAVFDSSRFERLCVLPSETPPSRPTTSGTYQRADSLLYRLRRILPYPIVARLLPAARRIKQAASHRLKAGTSPQTAGRLLRQHQVDLLFCPFTAPTYAEPGLPVISIVYDLQHRAYPQFFDPREVAGRDAVLEQLRRRVKTMICISEFTRQTLLTQLDVPAEQTQTAHVCIHSRLNQTAVSPDTLSALQLGNRPYLFYPANFWPHKNHRLLLTAYSLLLRRNPNLDLDLVFTGALAQPETELRFAVQTMGLAERVHFLGYLTDEQLAAVFQGCRMMIYPSLYEGFGIPLLEAFAFGKPVLCSNVTSLPEIGSEAALYFDPRKPIEIVQAIENLLQQPQLAAELVQRGYRRLAHFRQDEMARRYLEAFDRTLQRDQNMADGLIGVFDDGWLGQEVEISHRPCPETRSLELILTAPTWLPHRKITIQPTNGGVAAEKRVLKRGQTIALHLPLSPAGGQIILSLSPVFKPSDYAASGDERWLSCLCQLCQIIEADGSRKVLFAAPESEPGGLDRPDATIPNSPT